MASNTPSGRETSSSGTPEVGKLMLHSLHAWQGLTFKRITSLGSILLGGKSVVRSQRTRRFSGVTGNGPAMGYACVERSKTEGVEQIGGWPRDFAF
eukprot:364825-Chlamydomonas_euryale.AAC.4